MSRTALAGWLASGDSQPALPSILGSCTVSWQEGGTPALGGQQIQAWVPSRELWQLCPPARGKASPRQAASRPPAAPSTTGAEASLGGCRQRVSAAATAEG